jgi:hypothetical protein
MLSKKIIAVTICLLFGLLITVSCSSNSTSTHPKKPPKVPTAKSLKLNLSTFKNGKQKTSEANAAASAHISGTSYSNFGQTLNLIEPVLVIGGQLVVPALILSLAPQNNPQRNAKGQWVWNYSSSFNGNSFATKLVGARHSDGSSSWKFYTSGSTQTTHNRLLLSGSSNADNTKGSWVTYYNSSLFNKGEKLHKVDVVHWNTQGSHDITLKVKYVGDVYSGYTGAHLTYYSEGSILHLDYFASGSNNPITVQWNYQTNEGFVIEPNYNNGNKACWGSNYLNIPCSQI